MIADTFHMNLPDQPSKKEIVELQWAKEQRRKLNEMIGRNQCPNVVGGWHILSDTLHIELDKIFPGTSKDT